MIDISETSNNVRCTYSGYDATLTGCVEVTMTLEVSRSWMTGSG